MRALLIGLLHLAVGVITTFGWIAYGDSAGLINRPFDMFVQTVWPMSCFILTAAGHGYWSGTRQSAAGCAAKDRDLDKKGNRSSI